MDNLSDFQEGQEQEGDSSDEEMEELTGPESISNCSFVLVMVTAKASVIRHPHDIVY